MFRERGNHSVSKVSRRDFLKLAGLMGASYLSYELARSIPMRSEEVIVPNDYFFIEKSLPGRPSLLTEKGHFDYLGHIVTNHPIFKDKNFGVLPKAFKHIFTKEKDEPLVGEVFERYMRYAKEALEGLGIANPSEAQKFHIAVTSFAAVYSPLFRLSDIGGGFNSYHSFADITEESSWIDPYRKKLPRVFPMNHVSDNLSSLIIEQKYLGQDRAIHFAAHAYLAHQLFESFQHSFGDMDQIPRGLSLLAKLCFSDREKAELLDWVVGVGWEVVESNQYFDALYKFAMDAKKNGLSPNWKSNLPATNGLFSSDVGHDFRANSEGVDFVLDLPSNNFSSEVYTNKILRLNSDEVNRTLSQNIDVLPRTQIVHQHGDVYRFLPISSVPAEGVASLPLAL